MTHGSPANVLEEYFERGADADALGSEAARTAFVRSGRASLGDIYPLLEFPQRRFVDDFLRRTRTPAHLSHRIAVGWTDAYLTLMDVEEHTDRDSEVIGALTGPLTALLRARLPRGLAGGLSMREAQVAELVSLGFSNREIAGVLHVEEDTVKKHVSGALAKLSLERRTALAVAWATGRRMDVRGVLA